MNTNWFFNQPPGVQFQWISIVASVLGCGTAITILIHLYEGLQWWSHKRAFRQLYRELRKSKFSPPLIVLPELDGVGERQQSDIYFGKQLRFGDAAAFGKLIESLTTNAIKAEFRFHGDVKEKDLKSRNLILICGPGGNKITNNFFDENEKLGNNRIRFFFSRELGRWEIKTWDEHIGVTPAHPSDIKPHQRDYGILAKFPSPWSNSHVVFLVAGISGLGTFGAAYQASELIEDITKELAKKGRPKYSCFAALILTNTGSESPFKAIPEISKLIPYPFKSEPPKSLIFQFLAPFYSGRNIV